MNLNCLNLFYRNFYGTFCALLSLVFFSACQSVNYIVPNDEARVHIGAEPQTLNYITSTDAYASQVNGYLFDSLIDRDHDTLDYIPKMATRWEISDDKKTFTFYLRKDVRWHDGVPFTADDVIYSFNLIKDPKTNAPHLRVYYQDIDAIKKIDDYTVQFHSSQIYFLGFSQCGFMPIVPKHIVEKSEDFDASEFSRHPTGNGPFKFQKWVTNTEIVLTRNEDYWGPKPEIRTIRFRVIPDPSIGLQILKKGDLDSYGLSSIQWSRQTKSEKFDAMFYKFIYPSPGFSYIGWNNVSPIFSDPKVRRAMTYMIDRKTISEKLMFGLGKIVTGPFYPFSKQYNTDIKPIEYDLAKARELLKEAGWIDTDKDGTLDKNGKKFSFVFVYPAASNTAERISTIMKEDFKSVGIDMQILKLEWAAYQDRVFDKRDFDATNLGWSSPFEMDPYQIFDISQADAKGSSNYIAFKSKEASQLMSEARVEFDETKRNELYWRFQEILDDLQPYTFMFNQPSLEVVSRRFDNVKMHKTGLDLLEWKVKK